jgi:branched-chain amino acid aminotransferase
MPGLVVYINGAFVPEAEARISVFDHSFVYGDGVFEGIQVEAGVIYDLAEHVDRLYRSARYLDIVVPLDAKTMVEAIVEVAARSGLSDGYLRPLVSRGEGPLGMERMRELSRPNVVVIPQIRAARGERVLRAAVVATRRTPPACVDPRVKSNNYLNNILGKLEQMRAGVDVGIMLSLDGYVAEGCGENVFVVRDGAVWTPPASRSLEGITRGNILRLMREASIAGGERDLTPYDLLHADEVFVSASMTAIAYVVKIDGRRIGTGAPGPVARDLARRLREYQQRTGVRIPA